MAKSKRSKIKRKFRAIKRHKIAPKIAELIKRVTNMPRGGTGLPYVDASKALIKVVPSPPSADEPMETVVKSKPKLMNEHGNYPVWMNKRERRRQIGRRKRLLHKRKPKK
uniref:Protein LLP homolog n=1 Tax=Schistocephalus solidus TaxID=70667 RepID=A0A0X3NG77_SCHSO